MREIATIEPLGGDDMELVGVAVFAVVLLLTSLDKGTQPFVVCDG